MTPFEWAVLGLILIGVVVPFWLMLVLLNVAARRRPKNDPSERYFAYSRLMNYLRDSVPEDGKSNIFGPLLVATVRELRAYPEFSDLSILYLEEISVTGSNKFDRVLEQELKEAETFLLGSKND